MDKTPHRKANAIGNKRGWIKGVTIDTITAVNFGSVLDSAKRTIISPSFLKEHKTWIEHRQQGSMGNNVI